MEIQISGLEAVQKRLEETPSLLVAKVFEKALDRAIGVIAAEVAFRAPEGEEGLLKESVITAVNVDLQKLSGSAAVGFSRSQAGRTEKPQDLIAMWIEFGHRKVTHKPGEKEIGHVPANPFMREALVAAGDRAILVFENNLIDGLSVIEQS